jgi:hypothetical protein
MREHDGVGDSFSALLIGYQTWSGADLRAPLSTFSKGKDACPICNIPEPGGVKSVDSLVHSGRVRWQSATFPNRIS